MTNLYFFIAGIIFIAVAVPILNAITDIVLTVAEVLKSRMSVSIAEDRCIIMDLTGDQQTNAIGFSCSENKEEEEDIDFKTSSRVIGFGDNNVK